MRKFLKRILGGNKSNAHAPREQSQPPYIEAVAATQYQVTVFRKNSKIQVIGYIEATQEFIVNVPERNIARIKVPCKTVNRHEYIKQYFKKVQLEMKEAEKNAANEAAKQQDSNQDK